MKEHTTLLIGIAAAIAITMTATLEITHINDEVGRLRAGAVQAQSALDVANIRMPSKLEKSNQQHILVTAILNNCAGQTDINAISICKNDLLEMYRWCLADNSLAACSDPRIADYLRSQG